MELMRRLSCGCFPNLKSCASTSADQAFAARHHPKISSFVCWCLGAAKLLAVECFPEANRSIVADGGKNLVVETKGKRANFLTMTGEHGPILARDRVPETNRIGGIS